MSVYFLEWLSPAHGATVWGDVTVSFRTNLPVVQWVVDNQVVATGKHQSTMTFAIDRGMHTMFLKSCLPHAACYTSQKVNLQVHRASILNRAR
jgi:hypothetical protein